MAQIIEIEGIGPVDATELAGAGATPTGGLLKLATAAGRRALASLAGVQF